MLKNLIEEEKEKEMSKTGNRKKRKKCSRDSGLSYSPYKSYNKLKRKQPSA